MPGRVSNSLSHISHTHEHAIPVQLSPANRVREGTSCLRPSACRFIHAPETFVNLSFRTGAALHKSLAFIGTTSPSVSLMVLPPKFRPAEEGSRPLVVLKATLSSNPMWTLIPQLIRKTTLPCSIPAANLHTCLCVHGRTCRVQLSRATRHLAPSGVSSKNITWNDMPGSGFRAASARLKKRRYFSRKGCPANTATRLFVPSSRNIEAPSTKVENVT